MVMQWTRTGRQVDVIPLTHPTCWGVAEAVPNTSTTSRCAGVGGGREYQKIGPIHRFDNNKKKNTCHTRSTPLGQTSQTYDHHPSTKRHALEDVPDTGSRCHVRLARSIVSSTRIRVPSACERKRRFHLKREQDQRSGGAGGSGTKPRCEAGALGMDAGNGSDGSYEDHGRLARK